MRAVKQTFALLRTPGSPIGDSVARHLDQRGAGADLLDLDAPLRGEPVTVRPGSVVWQGVDLGSAAALLVERPVFPWPQPSRISELLRDGMPDQDRVGAQREARSLIASAIPAAAGMVRVVNPPVAAHLAASPAVALDGLEGAGLAVHPWRLAPAPDGGNGRLLLDAAGRDLWHEPGTPMPGDSAIELHPVDGVVYAVLVAGERPLAAARYPDAPSWVGGARATPIPPGELPTAAADLARNAVERLGIDLAAVAVTERPAVLWLDAGPDLAAWDRGAGGRVAAGLADHLIAVAGERGPRS
jgi:hypothetical protein